MALNGEYKAFMIVSGLTMIGSSLLLAEVTEEPRSFVDDGGCECPKSLQCASLLISEAARR